MKHLFWIGAMCAALSATAQQNTNEEQCYKEKIRAGEQHLKKGNWYEALESSYAAENCLTVLSSEQTQALKNLRTRVRTEINKQEEQLKKLQAEHERAQQKIKTTTDELDNAQALIKQQEEALAASKAALAKEQAALLEQQNQTSQADAFLKTFKFYYDKWAVVYLQQSGGYALINKKGEPLIPNRLYSKIDSFNTQFYHLAYATDTDPNKKQSYYLDTLGNECIPAKTLAEITPKTGLIDLRNQGLTEVPAAIAQCKNLRYLLLSGNKITALPDFVGQLSNLVVLHVAGNQIGELPANIGQLHQLRALYLTGNKITDLPAGFEQLTRLQHLYIDRSLEPILQARMGDKRPLVQEKW